MKDILEKTQPHPIHPKQDVILRKKRYDAKDVMTRHQTLRVATLNEEKTMTQQQFKDDVNVNNIIKRYREGRPITHLNNRQGAYADLSNAKDYHESLNTIRLAGEAFDSLPANIRDRFHNDPAELLEFIHNPSNFDEAVQLGIFDPKQPNIIHTPTPPTPPQNEQTQTNETQTKTTSKK